MADLLMLATSIALASSAAIAPAPSETAQQAANREFIVKNYPRVRSSAANRERSRSG